MAEIRIITGFTAARFEVNNALFLVRLYNPPHWPVAARYLIFELARREVVKVKMAPAAAFGKPDKLVRRGQITPVDGSLTRLKLCRAYFFKYIANGKLKNPMKRISKIAIALLLLSLPVAISLTQRLKSFIYAARLPSGEVTA